MTREQMYPSKNGYGVLNLRGPDNPRRPGGKSVVFHRVTKSSKLSCNGTFVVDEEHVDTVPEGMRPCKRCWL